MNDNQPIDSTPWVRTLALKALTAVDTSDLDDDPARIKIRMVKYVRDNGARQSSLSDILRLVEWALENRHVTLETYATHMDGEWYYDFPNGWRAVVSHHPTTPLHLLLKTMKVGLKVNVDDDVISTSGPLTTAEASRALLELHAL